MDGFFRILKKALSELICRRLYLNVFKVSSLLFKIHSNSFMTSFLYISELRLAQLALDPNNSPGWDVLEQERCVSTKMPLFVKSFLVCHNKMRQTEVTGGTSYTLLIQTPTRVQRPQT